MTQTIKTVSGTHAASISRILNSSGVDKGYQSANLGDRVGVYTRKDAKVLFDVLTKRGYVCSSPRPMRPLESGVWSFTVTGKYLKR